MRLFEYVDSYDENGKIVGQVKRIRSKYLFRFGLIAIVLGILSILNGLDWRNTLNATDEQLTIGLRFILFGCTLVFTLAPCLFLYPIIRGMSLSEKDSWLNVVITFITEEWIKGLIVDKIQGKKNKRKH